MGLTASVPGSSLVPIRVTSQAGIKGPSPLVVSFPRLSSLVLVHSPLCCFCSPSRSLTPTLSLLAFIMRAVTLLFALAAVLPSAFATIYVSPSSLLVAAADPLTPMDIDHLAYFFHLLAGRSATEYSMDRRPPKSYSFFERLWSYQDLHLRRQLSATDLPPAALPFY